MAQRALRAIMMHFSPSLLISNELVPSPYFAAVMAGNHLRRFGAGIRAPSSEGIDGSLSSISVSGSCRPDARGATKIGGEFPLWVTLVEFGKSAAGPVYPDQRKSSDLLGWVRANKTLMHRSNLTAYSRPRRRAQ
jgi:hypothetical protein